MSIEKCPVCEWDMKDGGIRVQVGGRQITVCCDECAEKARQDPTRYAPSR